MAESATGSFLFPPSGMKTGAELAAFFSTAPVSDRVLSNAQHSFTKWREDAIWNGAFAKLQAYQLTPKALKEAKRETPLQSKRDLEAKEAQFRAEEEAKLPGQMSMSDMRQILVARQISYYRGPLSPEEQEAALTTKIPYGGKPTAVGRLTEYFQTDMWVPRALTDSDLPAVDAMAEVSAALRQLGRG